MIALYVAIGLVVVVVLVQQVSALRRRSVRPSVERYHRAMDVLGEISYHVRVLDGHPLPGNETLRDGGDRSPAATPSGPVKPGVPAVLTPKRHEDATRSPMSVGPPDVAAPSAPLGGAMSPASDEPEPTGLANRRRRVYGAVLAATVVVGGTLLGLLLTASSPTQRLAASAVGANRIRATRAPSRLGAVSHETLPNLVGLTEGKAETLLRGAGLRWRRVNVASPDPAAAGIVLAQAPSSSSTVRRDAVVTLSVGRPYPSASVPNVTRPPESAQLARSALQKAGFTTKIDIVKATTVRELGLQGEVLNENPPAGSVKPKRSTVVIDVVEGEATVTIPDRVVGETPSQAGATLASAQLAVGTTISASSSTVPRGRVANTYPSAPGQSMAVGAKVNLVVSTGAVEVVPNLEGETVAEARRALRAVGLLLGHVSSGAGANDLVVAQAARPGRRLPEGTPIAVVVGISPPASSTTGSTAVA